MIVHWKRRRFVVLQVHKRPFDTCVICSKDKYANEGEGTKQATTRAGRHNTGRSSLRPPTNQKTWRPCRSKPRPKRCRRSAAACSPHPPPPPPAAFPPPARGDAADTSFPFNPGTACAAAAGAGTKKARKTKIKTTTAAAAATATSRWVPPDVIAAPAASSRATATMRRSALAPAAAGTAGGTARA